MSTTAESESAAVPIPQELISLLESWRRPLVVGHVRPDADCLGSLFAVSALWPATGGPAPVSLPDGSLSRRLAFLADWADPPAAQAQDFAEADGFVVLDTAQQSRCNVDRSLGDDWGRGCPIINIDHHTSNTNFGTVNWVDPGAGSTCELVYRLVRAAGRPITPLVASVLYAGLHSDTVGFSLPTTTSSALHAAADLIDCGARVAEIGEHLCRSQSQPEFALNRVIYGNTRIVADGRVAYSTASFEEITAAECTLADIDEQVAIPRSLRGIKIAVLLTEGKKGRTRLNIRGESGTNVLDLAIRFGGGGHPQAAGAILDATIEEAVQRVIPQAIEHLDGQDS